MRWKITACLRWAHFQVNITLKIIKLIEEPLIFTPGSLVVFSGDCSTILSPTGHLPSPESVHIYESINQEGSSTIGWSPPLTSLNTDIIHVEPHITQYTVYITDNYTGKNIAEQNITGTQFTVEANIRDSGLCPIYQVSAWNSGGEGELSEPVQHTTPQGRQWKPWPTASSLHPKGTFHSYSQFAHLVHFNIFLIICM